MFHRERSRTPLLEEVVQKADFDDDDRRCRLIGIESCTLAKTPLLTYQTNVRCATRFLLACKLLGSESPLFEPSLEEVVQKARL